MKIYFKILLTVFAIIIVFLGASVGIGLGAKRINSNLTLSGLFNTEYRLTAHRGFSSVAPENTAPALAEAGKAGFYAAEFDIIPTADGVWVLIHDDTVDRTMDGEGEVEKLTFGSTELPNLIKASAGESDFDITLIGLCTDICVVSNALILKANFYDKNIIVIENEDYDKEIEYIMSENRDVVIVPTYTSLMKQRGKIASKFDRKDCK